VTTLHGFSKETTVDVYTALPCMIDGVELARRVLKCGHCMMHEVLLLDQLPMNLLFHQSCGGWISPPPTTTHLGSKSCAQSVAGQVTWSRSGGHAAAPTMCCCTELLRRLSRR
jgi:hypothetical protein